MRWHGEWVEAPSPTRLHLQTWIFWLQGSACRALYSKKGALSWALWPSPWLTPTVSHEISKCNSPTNSYFFDLPEPCSFEGRVFQDGEEWQLSQCAKCVCRNGATQCFTVQCQPLFCNQVRKTISDWSFHSPLTAQELGVFSEILSGSLQSTRNRKPGLFLFSLCFWRPPLRHFFFPLEATDRYNYQSFRLIVT
jgi:hypothetical protein